MLPSELASDLIENAERRERMLKVLVCCFLLKGGGEFGTSGRKRQREGRV